MNLGLRFGKMARRQEVAEAIVRKHLPGGFSISAETIVKTHWWWAVSPNIPYYSMSYFDGGGTQPPRTTVAVDLNINSDSGRTVLQVRLWNNLLNSLIIRYDPATDPQLAQTIARALRREAYLLPIPVIDKLNILNEFLWAL